ncbi:hypothetical protein J437_LFUL018559 [Ladona fulva]|uniref:Uncharacterized protein n=1 Tax=Ladona fulva TaxID=123851 RepID=A0A8K0KPL9_LADFU|nr:hypothetical protein J437_LFUL018559 [Ladona fulva]
MLLLTMEVTKKAVKDLFGEEKHLSCFAHCIHLVATAGLSKVPDVQAIIGKNPHSPPMLSGYELDVLREFRTTLSPLEQITRELSGQKYTCLAGQIRETGEARNLSKSLINELKLCFHDTESNKLYAVSTLLDPRCKRLHIRNSTRAIMR